MRRTPYEYHSPRTSPRMTLFMPGQRPPQVTIPATTSSPRKKLRWRGPATSIVALSAPVGS